MKAPPTAGEWYYESDGEGIPSQHRDKYVCAEGAGRIVTLITPPGASQHEVIANGRLIASAPNLLQTLKLISALASGSLQVINCESLRQARDMADAAIAKATRHEP